MHKKYFQHQAGKPLKLIPLVAVVTGRLLRIMEANDLNHLGYEPKTVKCFRIMSLLRTDWIIL